MKRNLTSSLPDPVPEPTLQDFESWSTHLDALIEALGERYFTGQANFYRDEDTTDPLILVIVTGTDQDDMEQRFSNFMNRRILPKGMVI